MSTQAIISTVIGFFGFLISLGLTAGLIAFLRKPLKGILEKLVGDEDIAKKLMLFVFILIGLAGLVTALGAFYPAEHGFYLFNADKEVQFNVLIRYALFGLMDLLNRFASALQWSIVAIAIFFVGYSVRHGPAKK